jgi:hypothetical protein
LNGAGYDHNRALDTPAPARRIKRAFLAEECARITRRLA